MSSGVQDLIVVKQLKKFVLSSFDSHLIKARLFKF